jgi:UDP-N-acetylmuramoyl-tripeptide--D-alanyl-D-alanine ligase
MMRVMATKSNVLTVADLAVALAKTPPPPDVTRAASALRIRTVVIDSRRATPGSLFIAMRGEQRDGHDFIADAVARGAVAILAEQAPATDTGCQILRLEDLAQFSMPALQRPICLIVPDSLSALQQAATYWRRQHDVTVVGITGSVGKTTSKEVIAAVLSQRFRTLKSHENYNNEIGLPLTLLHLTSAHQEVVLEMGMYDIGEIAHLAEIARPRIGVVTNVGPTHLARLGTIERIAQAKAELPQALPAAKDGGVAILNADDERVRAMADQTRARVFTYGLASSADLWADDIESEGLEGIRFRLHHGQETIHMRVPMLGRHSVHAALRAAAVGLVEDLSWSEILAGLRDESAQLRLLSVPGPAGSMILDDTYNASPASSLAALNLLEELDGRKIAVLGDMYELGRYEEEGHRMVGRRARAVVDVLVTVGPLGRIIGDEAVNYGMAPDRVHQVETNAQATELLRTLLEPGDRVLIKGSRGMEMEQVVAALADTPGPVEAPRKEARP